MKFKAESLFGLANIKSTCVVKMFAMMNELIEIQKEMGQPSRGRSGDRDKNIDGDTDPHMHDPLDWLGSPVDNSRFHKDYTTVHWLHVFRAIKSVT